MKLRALPVLCQAPQYLQRFRHQHETVLLCIGENPLCRTLEAEEKVYVIEPPAQILVLDWAPSLADSLLPVVYFLSCYPAEEGGGLGLNDHLCLHLPHLCVIVGDEKPFGSFHEQVPGKQLVCVCDTDEPYPYVHRSQQEQGLDLHPVQATCNIHKSEPREPKLRGV